MEKVYVRVVGKPFRRHQPGDVIHVSRQDAKVLTAIGQVEAMDGQPLEVAAQPEKPAPKAPKSVESEDQAPSESTKPAAKRTSAPRKSRKAK